MGGLEQEITGNRKPDPLCRSFKKMTNALSKNHDEGTNPNTNILKHGYKNQFMTLNISNPLKVCHQNIRGLVGKTQELLCSLLSDLPHIVCLSEHHLKEFEINNILIDNYDLGAKYSRTSYENGGVCIFIHSSIKYNNISLEKYCVEKDIEVCACKLLLTNIKIIVLTIYRSPSGNFDIFLQNLDNILSSLYNKKSEFIICGDVNINYLENCDRRQQLDTLLSTFNLTGTVNFPTRCVKNSRTAIDNIYISIRL